MLALSLFSALLSLLHPGSAPLGGSALNIDPLGGTALGHSAKIDPLGGTALGGARK